MGLDAMIFAFRMLSLKPAFSLSSFTFIKRFFSSSSLSAIRVVSLAYLGLLVFLPAILISTCTSRSTAFHMMYSAYKFKKQGDDIQPWHTPFPILNQHIGPCLVLTVTFWPAYRFLRRQVRQSDIFISLRIVPFVVIHTVNGFSLVYEAEVDVFLEFLCFFCDPTWRWQFDLCSSTFFKSSLYIWKSSVHMLLKPGLMDLSITLLDGKWVQLCGSGRFFGIALLWDWNEKLNFSSPVATAEFSKFAGILNTAL